MTHLSTFVVRKRFEQTAGSLSTCNVKLCHLYNSGSCAEELMRLPNQGSRGKHCFIQSTAGETTLSRAS